MHIDIEKLELADVLVALVNAGATNTMTIQGKLPQLTHRIARGLIQEGIDREALHFDSVLGRTLRIDLNDDVIDVTAYDKANGVGTALKTLQAIGEVKIAHTLRFNNEMRSLKGSMEDRLSDRPNMLMAERFVPNKADMDAWMARWEAASPEAREQMIHDDSIKYAYPTKLEGYDPLNSGIDGDLLNSAFFSVQAASRIGSVDIVASSATMPNDKAEYMSSKARLLKAHIAEVNGDGEGYYVKQLGRLDELPTVPSKNK